MKIIRPEAYKLYVGTLVGIAVDTRNNTVFCTIGDTDLMIRGRGWRLVVPYDVELPRTTEEFTVTALKLEKLGDSNPPVTYHLTLVGKRYTLQFTFKYCGEEFPEDDDDSNPWIYNLNL